MPIAINTRLADDHRRESSRKALVPKELPAPAKFVADSPLEGAGFEPSVPRRGVSASERELGFPSELGMSVDLSSDPAQALLLKPHAGPAVAGIARIEENNAGMVERFWIGCDRGECLLRRGRC